MNSFHFVVLAVCVFAYAQSKAIKDLTKPQIIGPCNVTDCSVYGECRKYYFCVRQFNYEEPDSDLGHLHLGLCPQPLFFNPDIVPYGGHCDFWHNLSDEVKEEYKNDEECVARCHFITENGGCSEKYVLSEPIESEQYLPEPQYTNTSLQCNDGLVFDPAVITCVHPEDCSI